MATTKKVGIVSGSVVIEAGDATPPVDSKSSAHLVTDKTIKAAFDTAASHGLSSSHQYEKVAVLLVRWADHFDKDLNCGPEVADLEKVFREDYNYHTTLLTLDDIKSPQLQLKRGILNWIYDHDGDHRKNLLIIYYSGHGQDTTDTFNIVGKRTAGLSPISDVFEAKADWMKATASLKTEAQSDVLMIVDSCFAGSIMDKGGSCDQRLLQALLATGRDSVAQAPGPKSFTRAMIAVLKDSFQRGREDDQEYFDTFRLRTEIDKRRKKHGHLVNLIGNDRIIRLMPLPQQDDTIPSKSTDAVVTHAQGSGLQVNTLAQRTRSAQRFPAHLLSPEASTISLRFSFSKDRAITEKGASELGQELAQVAREKLAKFGIRGIELTELVRVDPSRKISGVIQLALLYCAVRRAERLWRRRTSCSIQSGHKRTFDAVDEGPVDSSSSTTSSDAERPLKKTNTQNGLSVESISSDEPRPMTPQSPYK